MPEDEEECKTIIAEVWLREETMHVFSGYTEEFVAAMTDEDVAELADILAERAEIIVELEIDRYGLRDATLRALWKRAHQNFGETQEIQ